MTCVLRVSITSWAKVVWGRVQLVPGSGFEAGAAEGKTYAVLLGPLMSQFLLICSATVALKLCMASLSGSLSCMCFTSLFMALLCAR